MADVVEALDRPGVLGMAMHHDVWVRLLAWIDEQRSPS